MPLPTGVGESDGFTPWFVLPELAESDGVAAGLDGGGLDGVPEGDGDCDGDCEGLVVGLGDGEAAGDADGEPEDAAGDGDGDWEALAEGDVAAVVQAVAETPG